MHQIGSRRLALTRMVGTGQAPQGYHKGQVFDVDDLDEGTVEDLERKGWATRVAPADDPGRDKVSIANAMVRGDSLLDPHDRAIAEEIGDHDTALAIIHGEDPDATPESYEEEANKGRERNALGMKLSDDEIAMGAALQRETANLVAGGNRFGNAPEGGKAQNEQRQSSGQGSAQEGGSGQSSSSDAPDATPSAEAYAKEKGIDLSTVKGSGQDGRITKEDVEKAESGS
jgi:pyruvate/2-oxoglutarate dehydrogenase complex dihydrolipoamide acyltransferase (E2) component